MKRPPLLLNGFANIRNNKSIASTSFVGSHVEQTSMVSHHALPFSLD
jgi:hypothetical protein